nr:MAG TPA: hypothetical protein [Caudoviricetes sp.]
MKCIQEKFGYIDFRLLFLYSKTKQMKEGEPNGKRKI